MLVMDLLMVLVLIYIYIYIYMYIYIIFCAHAHTKTDGFVLITKTRSTGSLRSPFFWSCVMSAECYLAVRTELWGHSALLTGA